MWPLAVTGGVAEGKSTVVGFLSELGVSTFSADQAVKELWQNPEVISQICSALNLSENAPKSAILEAMSQDWNARRLVNSFFHPLVWERMEESDAQVFEVPLLLEACLQAHFSRVWVVTCGPDEQLKRLTDRLGNRTLAESVRSLQLSGRVKLAFADETIRTNCEISSVKESTLQAAQREFGW